MTLNTNNDKAILNGNKVIEILAIREGVSVDVVNVLDSFGIGDENSGVTGYLLQIEGDPSLYEATIDRNGEIKIQ